jgi:hypothetical protein
MYGFNCLYKFLSFLEHKNEIQPFAKAFEKNHYRMNIKLKWTKQKVMIIVYINMIFNKVSIEIYCKWSNGFNYSHESSNMISK